MPKTPFILTISLIFIILHNAKAMAGELSYTCEVKHVYRLSSDGSLKPWPIQNHHKGDSFSVSRVTGEIIGEAIPTLQAKSTSVINKGSAEWSFKAVADFNGNEIQMIEVREFEEGVLKPFVSKSFWAGIVTGLCK